eukprot:TRINITY_DN418_c0_g5_i1.p1 TRINITY_DN418_c0_g5~~TRINITY_DN418_c0_g5_i1.p1  ORF type:complete len:166 (-),score=43.43 TRINITY_DN418_c0_g5_i1:45-542(-)
MAAAREEMRKREERRRQDTDATATAAATPQEEEETRLQREREEKEQKEYQAWKGEMEVSESGSREDELAALSKRTPALIAHLTSKKVSVLEEVAAEFGVKTADLVSKIQELEGEGLLTGVVDDCGKYIHLHQRDLLAVASFVQKHGRVSISDLATESNRLIKLDT